MEKMMVRPRFEILKQEGEKVKGSIPIYKKYRREKFLKRGRGRWFLSFSEGAFYRRNGRWSSEVDGSRR